MPETAPASSRSLTFVIQDMNTWAGQERCTLEVARRLSHLWPVEIYAFTLDDPLIGKGWGNLTFHPIRPNISRPELVKSTYFYGATLPFLMRRRTARRRRATLIHAAGACALLSDVVQVHFVQAAWREIRRRLPEDLLRPSGAGAARGPRSILLKAYQDLLLTYNVAVERMVFRPEKTYIAVSQGVARELDECLGLRERVHVVRHGVDPALFHPVDASSGEERLAIRRRLGIEPTEIAVLFVGAFDRKGLARVIDAAALIEPGTLGRMRIVVVGSGDRDRFVERARSRGIEDRLILAGYQKEVASYYRAADVFLFPTSYEPFGMAILEAMASGLPSIVSRSAGAAELIVNGESGFLLQDPADTREIASALGRLVEDGGARTSLGREARRVADRRSWDQVAREYAAVLDPLMKRPE